MGSIGVVGAGAKAAALVARAYVLERLRYANVPKITVFEKDDIAAAWSGDRDYSDGFQSLCTLPERDVGYPYHEHLPTGGSTLSISREMAATFSWTTYLVEIGRFAEWVDRNRPYPQHSAWASYLKWVFEKANAEVVVGKVTYINYLKSGKYNLKSAKADGSVAYHVFDGIVLTGTGKPKPLSQGRLVPRGKVFTAQDFWPRRGFADDLKDATIVVAGSGGAAGAILAYLAERLERKRASLVSVSSTGTLFPRGDGYSERRWYSDPSDWRQLSLEQRRKILERTEAGVISARNKAIVDESIMIQYAAGRVKGIHGSDDELRVDLGPGVPSIACDFFVNATGFDAWTLLDVVDRGARPSVDEAGKREAEDLIDENLCLPTAKGFPPRLHVPGLAGLAQGPGMGNLGSLGLMADAVFRPYMP